MAARTSAATTRRWGCSGSASCSSPARRSSSWGSRSCRRDGARTGVTPFTACVVRRRRELSDPRRILAGALVAIVRRARSRRIGRAPTSDQRDRTRGGGVADRAASRPAARSLPASSACRSSTRRSAAYAGSDAKAINPVFVQLIRNLSPGQAPNLRIGGDTTDWTWWPVPGMPKPGGVRLLADQDLGAGHGRARRTSSGPGLILGINLEVEQRHRGGRRGAGADRRDRAKLDRGARARQRARAVRQLHLVHDPERPPRHRPPTRL